jgi:Ni/Co efflux regulator RcnB
VKTNLLKRLMAAAILSAVWLVGMSVAANAQDQQQEHEQKKEMKRREKQERKEAKHERHENNGHHYGRISDEHYRAHFGRGHEFRMVRFRMEGGYHRFAYGGYTFGFVQPWPARWRHDDRVYVEYLDGGYFLCNPRYPGIRISLTIF